MQLYSPSTNAGEEMPLYYASSLVYSPHSWRWRQTSSLYVSRVFGDIVCPSSRATPSGCWCYVHSSTIADCYHQNPNQLHYDVHMVDSLINTKRLIAVSCGVPTDMRYAVCGMRNMHDTALFGGVGKDARSTGNGLSDSVVCGVANRHFNLRHSQCRGHLRAAVVQIFILGIGRKISK